MANVLLVNVLAALLRFVTTWDSKSGIWKKKVDGLESGWHDCVTETETDPVCIAVMWNSCYFCKNTVFERSHDIMVEFSPPEALVVFFLFVFLIFFVNLHKKLNIRIWLTPQCCSGIGNLSLKSCTLCLRELQFKVQCIGLRFAKEFSIVKVMAIVRRR